MCNFNLYPSSRSVNVTVALTWRQSGFAITRKDTSRCARSSYMRDFRERNDLPPTCEAEGRSVTGKRGTAEGPQENWPKGTKRLS